MEWCLVNKGGWRVLDVAMLALIGATMGAVLSLLRGLSGL